MSSVAAAFAFRLLGGCALQGGDGHLVTGRVMQRRRLACLALIAAAGRRGISRDKVVAYLWSERETEAARHQLSDTVYVLRAGLREDVLSASGDVLVLNPDVVACDVTAFQDAIARGNHAAAIAAHTGPFLDGFHLPDAMEFERWADAERDRLAALYQESLETLAVEAIRRGEPAAAVPWWRRLAASRPYDSRAARELVLALDAAGDRAGALRQLQIHAQLLRELDVEPDGDLVTLGERLRVSHSVRAIATVDAILPVASAPPAHDRPYQSPLLPSPGTSPADARTHGRSRPLSHSVVLSVLGVVVLGVAVTLALRASASPGYRLGDTAQVTLEQGLEIAPVLSPDGSLVAYLSGPVTGLSLLVRSVSGGAPMVLASGLECRPWNPQWSPDGTRILFDCGGAVYVTPFPRGAPTVIAAHAGVVYANACWSPDGRRIAYVENSQVLKTHEVSTGEAKEVARGSDIHSTAWSHDGRWIAAVTGNAAFNRGINLGNLAPSAIVVVRAEGGAFESVTNNRFLHMSPVWAPDDRGLFLVSSEGGARNIHFLALDGNRRPMGLSQRLTTGLRAASLAISRDGKRMTYTSYERKTAIWSIPLTRTRVVTLTDAIRLTSANEGIVGVSVSTDGEWLAFDSDRSGNADIWTMPAAGGEPLQLTTDTSDEFNPTWSPDGRWIAFHSWHNGNRDLFMISSRGGRAQQITTDTVHDLNPKWSPDGKRLAFYSTRQGRRPVINTLTRIGDSTWGELRELADSGGAPNWSPDGRWLSYPGPGPTLRVVSADGGRSRTVLGSFDIRGRREGISAGMWSSDGRELLFSTNDEEGWKVFSVSVSGGAPRLRLRADGASPVTGLSTTLHAGRLYFVLGTAESDVYVVDLHRAR